MFWRNLNVFVPIISLLLKVVGGPLVMLLTVAAMMIFQKDVRIGFVFMPLVGPVLAAVLGYRWWRHGLAPASLNPARSRWHLYGHLILAVANFVAIALFAFSFLMVPYVWAEWRPTYNPDQRLYGSLVGPVSQVVTATWVVGLLLVFSARARPMAKPPRHPDQGSAV